MWFMSKKNTKIMTSKLKKSISNPFKILFEVPERRVLCATKGRIEFSLMDSL